MHIYKGQFFKPNKRGNGADVVSLILIHSVRGYQRWRLYVFNDEDILEIWRKSPRKGFRTVQQVRDFLKEKGYKGQLTGFETIY